MGHLVRNSKLIAASNATNKINLYIFKKSFQEKCAKPEIYILNDSLIKIWTRYMCQSYERYNNTWICFIKSLYVDLGLLRHVFGWRWQYISLIITAFHDDVRTSKH